MNKVFHARIEENIIENLFKAEKEVKIAVAWFTNPSLFGVILQLVEKRVSVKIIMCDDKMNFLNPKLDFQKLIDLGVTIRVSKYPRLMHNKFCLIDNQVLLTGSYNWTLRAERFNFENIIISTERKLIREFADYFTKIETDTAEIVSVSEIDLRDYMSLNEAKLELRETNKEILKKEETNEENVYDDEIECLIDEAEVLYKNAEHLKCIEFCKDKIKKYPKIPEFYLTLASSYWRTNNNKLLIDTATAAIAIDNKLYDAYNLLGIGFSRESGGEQKSIRNYDICLNKNGKEHAYLRNRAIMYMQLADDNSIPSTIRQSKEKKAIIDFKTIIQVVSSKPLEEQNYSELHSRAIAYDNLRKSHLALDDINSALKKYRKLSNKFELDINEYQEMKIFQRDLKTFVKSNR